MSRKLSESNVYRPYRKMRKISERGYFPPASAKDVIKILSLGEPRAYLAVERFLDTEPKKSLPEDLAEMLAQKGIKIGDDYILPSGLKL